MVPDDLLARRASSMRIQELKTGDNLSRGKRSVF